MNKKNMKPLLVALATGSVVNVASAASIAWTTGTITDINDIVTTGTLVQAINASATGAADVTAAGITFVSDDSIGSNNTGFDAFTGTTGDAGYDTLLSNIDFGPNSQPSATVNFSGLTVGNDYLLQFWYSDAAGTTRTITLDGTGDNELSVGEFGVGIFTADATDQDLIFEASANGIRVNAIQLRDVTVAVPEPSSTALLGLGALSLLVRRRR